LPVSRRDAEWRLIVPVYLRCSVCCRAAEGGVGSSEWLATQTGSRLVGSRAEKQGLQHNARQVEHRSFVNHTGPARTHMDARLEETEYRCRS